MVEFALVLPLLMILLLGIADFGRVFAAGITIEAATRNAAEAAAQEYLQLDRNGSSIDYGALHQRAIDVACNEARLLPNFAAGGGGCLMPVVDVCVHDDANPGDAGCGSDVSSPPAACGSLAGWDHTQANGSNLPYVEVRACYRFDMLMQLPVLPLGPVWIQRAQTFSVAQY